MPYARIDIAGTHIMGVELIEPYLHLEYIGISGRPASEMLAEAIAMFPLAWSLLHERRNAH